MKRNNGKQTSRAEPPCIRVTLADEQEEHAAHLFELTSDRHFGKGLLADSFGRKYHYQQMQCAGASDGT
jgi:hypothetical protein